MTSRRKFIMVLGGGIITAAVGGAAWVATRDPARAREAWTKAGQDAGDPRRKALSYAVLAPNPHNRQPWIVDLSKADEITLTCDPDRRLEHTDPFDRQITVGLGCFIELLAQAAAEDGFDTDVALFPEGEPADRLDGRPVARIRIVKNEAAVRDPLFLHILDRRTNRNPYDTARPVETGTLTQIAKAARTSAVFHTNDPARLEGLRALSWAAMDLEIRNYATAKESVDLTRIGRAEIEANPDGISLAGPLLEGLALTGLLNRDDMLDQNSSTFQQQIPFLKASFDTAMGFLWLTTPGNTRADQIRAGRDYVRVNLAATGLGVAMQPFSQALQEFPEMAEYRQTMLTTLAIDTADTLQMFVRLGYGPAPKGSPRWPMETRIKAA